MLLFWTLDKFAQTEGTGDIHYFDIDDFENDKCDIPEEYYSHQNAGWPIVLVRDNYPTLFGLKGIVPYNDAQNRFEIEKIDESRKFKIGGMAGRVETLSYDQKNHQVIKFLIYLLCYEAVFYDRKITKGVMKKTKDGRVFDYDTIRQDPTTRIYYSVIEEELHKYNFVMQDWEKVSPVQYTMEKYLQLPYEVEFNSQVCEMMRLPEDSTPTHPSIWTCTKYRSQKPDCKDYNFVKKFGCSVTVRKINPIQVSKDTDLKKWETVSHLTDTYRDIFNGGAITDLLHTVPITDTYPCLFYDDYHDKYFFYNRANIIIGSRYISVTTSPDLKTWSSAEMIQTNPKFSYARGDNYYVPSMMKYRGTPYVFAVMTYYHLSTRRLDYQIYISEDGIRFDYVSTFHSHIVKLDPERNEFHWNLNLMTFLPDSMYVQDNMFKMFYTCHSHTPNYRSLFRLSIPQDRFSSLRGEDFTVTTHPVKVTSQKWSLNYKTAPWGNLKIQVLSDEENYRVLWESEELSGDEFEYALSVPVTEEKVRLRIMLQHAELFSIRGVEYLPIQKTYSAVEFVYLDLVDMNIYRNNVKKNRWMNVELCKGNGVTPVRLVGQPVHSNKNLKVTQTVEYSNGTFSDVVLVDNLNVLNPQQRTPFVIHDLRLI